MSTNKETNLNSWELPEALWEILKPLIPPKKSNRGRPVEVDYRRIPAGIFYVLRTGIQWQACPREKFGPPSTVYCYFSKWCELGIFKKMWEAALEIYDDSEGLDWEWQSVDGAMTKSPPGGEGTGPNPTDRAKQGTKRSLMTDGNGIPVANVSDAANVNDFKLSEDTLQSVVTERPDTG
jgi:putative transposase